MSPTVQICRNTEGSSWNEHLPAVATAAGQSVAEAKTIHSRPALFQELEWRPQPLGPSSQTDAAKEVVFSFYDGQLFRITISYDRYATEGLTTADYIDAISTTYGMSSPPDAPTAAPWPSGDEEQVVAQWQDSEYRFELVRAKYGPTFRLVGVLKKNGRTVPSRTVGSGPAR